MERNKINIPKTTLNVVAYGDDLTNNNLKSGFGPIKSFHTVVIIPVYGSFSVFVYSPANVPNIGCVQFVFIVIAFFF